MSARRDKQESNGYFEEDSEIFNRTGTGVLLRIFQEPRALSSKRDRDARNVRYVPPAPRPHHLRTAPSQTRLLHSRSNDSHDLDSSFHMLIQSTGQGSSKTFFRQFFEIQERLGFGSFGDVFRVKSHQDGKEYAVKKSRNTFTGEGDRSRQLKEVQRVVNIPSHSHLVSLEQAWEEEGHLYLQMELCSKSLNQFIEEGDGLDEYQSWGVLIDMLFALQHLHKHHLVHMDVKPDNIFLSLNSPTIYKLGDFGIVVSLEETRDITEYTDGDSRYLASELMQGRVTTKADVFSLGLTILEVSCHVDLPKGGDLWHNLRAGDEFPPPCDKLIPSSLREVLQMMLDPDVSKRPEVEDLLKHPDVKAQIQSRYWSLTRANLRRRIGVLTGFLQTLMNFFASLNVFFGTKNPGLPSDQARRTPEPCPPEVPNVLLNDVSFSDDDNDVHHKRAETPPYASTPISHSKGSSARLRSGRFARGANGENKLVGSPTSRNLLKEFEAVSD